MRGAARTESTYPVPIESQHAARQSIRYSQCVLENTLKQGLSILDAR